MSGTSTDALSTGYRAALRMLLRFAIAMAVVGLLTGISFQESARKLPFSAAGAGLRLESVINLALVHGHVFTMGVLMPLALAGALLMARRIGGRDVGPRALRWLLWGYLPAAAATSVLQLVKGYHFLLAVRHGATDLALVDAAFLGGHGVARYVVYGAVHGALGLCLVVFLVALWRSLPRN